MASLNQTLDDGTLLDELNQEKITEYIPAIVFVAVVIICGIIGNIMTVVFYIFKTKRTPTTTLMSALAAIDLITCFILVDEIIELCFIVKYTNIGACKFTYFINHSFVLSSVLLLWLISIDRFKRICRPFDVWQFEVRSCKIAILVLCIVSVCLSVRDFVIYDSVRVNITNNHGQSIQGFYCTQSDKESLQSSIIAWNLVDLVLLIIITITFIVLYSFIVRTIIKTKWKSKKMIIVNSIGKERYFEGKDVKTTSNPLHVGSDARKTDETKTESETEKPKRKRVISICAPRQIITQDDRRIFKTETKITMMMVSITFGYFVSFTPYFVVKIMSGSNEQEQNVSIQIALRSFILNSAINPYIIGIFNVKFRQFVSGVFRRICVKNTQN